MFCGGPRSSQGLSCKCGRRRRQRRHLHAHPKRIRPRPYRGPGPLPEQSSRHTAHHQGHRRRREGSAESLKARLGESFFITWKFRINDSMPVSKNLEYSFLGGSSRSVALRFVPRDIHGSGKSGTHRHHHERSGVTHHHRQQSRYVARWRLRAPEVGHLPKPRRFNEPSPR